MSHHLPRPGLRAHGLALGLVLAMPALIAAGRAEAQSARRDGIADLLTRNEPRVAQAPQKGQPGASGTVPAAAGAKADKDPREGEANYEQARRLMAEIDAILRDTARQRGDAKKLPSKDDYLVPPIWTETREDREAKIRNLLDSALGIVTDVPVVETQKKIEGLRKNIRELDERITRSREKQLSAPKDALLPGITADTVDSLAKDMEESRKKIEANREAIRATKAEVTGALAKSGVQLAPEQIDLLLESVLAGDLVRLVATFDAAKAIDGQLAKLLAAAGEDMAAARKYFAMHAALFAILVHAQDTTIAKIDTNYVPKLDAILKDIGAARQRTHDLLRAENRPDQKRALEANRDSQKVAEEAARSYRNYLRQQREQIARARSKAAHDLKIADNTYETVEASFQLRNLMRDSSSSFEALQRLEAPTFDQIFKNEELRREFENLTRKLDAPTS